MPVFHRNVIVRHWLPILTWCPVNHLPDLIYVSVIFTDDKDHELYAVRRQIRRIVRGRKRFMEDLAEDVLTAIPDAEAVTVRLAFDRHNVTVYRDA
jgi:hypothetical protein